MQLVSGTRLVPYGNTLARPLEVVMSNNQLIAHFAFCLINQLIHRKKARHAHLPRHP